MKDFVRSPLLTAAVFLCCFQTFRAFAQPTNIGCTNAAELLLDTNYVFNTASAGSPADPTNICSSPFGKGVWFSFRAPRDGVLTLNTCGSDFDTVIGIYTGTCGALTDYSCADDNGPACPGAQASISLPVTENTTFYILVGGYDGASGNLQFTASISPPPNDQCTNAVALTNGAPYLMNTAGAAGTNDVPWDGCNYRAGYGVWFTYTPASTGPLTISTSGSAIGTVIEVFTGDCGNLNKVTCGQGQPSFVFQATNGVTYLLYVAGYTEIHGDDYPAFGPLQIEAAEGSVANDGCNAAVPLTNGIPIFTDTTTATSTNDPLALNGVWYTFTPESNGVVTISTCGSAFPTAFQVYTGSCDSLSAMTGGYAAGYGPACTYNASVSFETSVGFTYYILAGGLGGAVGKMQIQATLSPSLNDHCQNAIQMMESMNYLQNTVASTTNGDPVTACGYRLFNTVWYTYMAPPDNGVITITTCGSDFTTGLQVYTGSCDNLSPAPGACSVYYGPACTNNRASVSFENVPGTTYYIMVGGANNVSQAGNLQIRATLSDSLNDHCQNAIPMQDGVVYTRNTVAATTTGDPAAVCNYLFNTVWYTYTPASNGVVTISTCGSDFATGMQVYSGNCSALAPVADGCGEAYDPSCTANLPGVSFKALAGVTYYVMVGGASTASQAGNLQIRATLSPPLNDDCQNAIAMQDGVVYTRSTAASTSTGDPKPSCQLYSSFGKGVWYTYTPARNGAVIVNTCGSDFPTALQIYTGNCGALNPVLNACNSGYGVACPTNAQASLIFDGAAGTTYRILVGGTYGGTGNLQIQATLAPPLTNDLCDGAIALTNGIPYSENTETATSLGDPSDGKGVWFSFTPSTDGVVSVGTCGSDYSTTLQIYTGGCNSLTPVQDGNDYGYGPLCRGTGSSVVFLARAGTNYLIFVTGNGNAALFGNLQIEAALHPALPNDQCSGAIDITRGGTYLVDTTLATSVGDFENGCGGKVKGVWYSITPVSSDLITISIESSNVFPALEVFQGTCGQLTNLLCTSDYYGYPFTSLAFHGVVGRTYYIQAGGFAGATGNFIISAGTFSPPNDQCYNAIRMNPGLKYAMNTAFASSTNDPAPLCNATASNGVWYVYTPTEDAPVTVKTCDSDFATVLQVFSGDNSSLTPVVCNDGFGPACATDRASVSFLGKAGTNYYILAAGKNGASGNLSISANGPPPANDTCDAAIDMTEGVVYTTNTAYASSTGDAFPITKGVWYWFSPTRAGLLLLDTCGSDFQTAFNVYTGACNSLGYYNGSATSFATPCASNRANAEFPVLPGVTYYIDVGGNQSSLGGNLSISATLPPPPNDTCENASPLGFGYVSRMNTANATETGDPTPLCQTNFGRGVWFTVTPPMSGTVSVSTCSGDLDSVLQVYTGGCGALTPVANSCNDDYGPDCAGFTASVHFAGESGVTYWILVGGYGGAGGNLGIEANILPMLAMQRTATSSILSWPSNMNGFWPEFTTNLTPPVLWNSMTGATTFKDGNYFLTNSIPGNAIFYRLKK